MSKLDQALKGLTQIGMDTSPFIYLIEAHPQYAPIVRSFVALIDSGHLFAYSSVITLTEILSRPMRLGLIELERQYRNLLLNSSNISLLPVDTLIATQAAELRAQFNLRTPDALQIAAALSVGCEAFLTNDRKLKRVTHLPILVLDEIA